MGCARRENTKRETLHWSGSKYEDDLQNLLYNGTLDRSKKLSAAGMRQKLLGTCGKLFDLSSKKDISNIINVMFQRQKTRPKIRLSLTVLAIKRTLVTSHRLNNFSFETTSTSRRLKYGRKWNKYTVLMGLFLQTSRKTRLSRVE